MFMLGIRLPLAGSKSPKSGKEGFGVKKHPFPTTPEKGVPSPKIPIFLVVLCIEMGIFWLRAPFWGGRKWGGFLTPKPSFPILGILTPVRGKRIPNVHVLFSLLSWRKPLEIHDQIT